jgi:hypothetical protein
MLERSEEVVGGPKEGQVVAQLGDDESIAESLGVKRDESRDLRTR